MKKIRTSTIDQAISKGDQYVIYSEYLTLDCADGVKKLHIEIKSDSYRSQCYARTSVLKDDKWNELYSIHNGVMTTQAKLAYKPKNSTLQDFKSDRDKLLAMSSTLLS